MLMPDATGETRTPALSLPSAWLTLPAMKRVHELSRVSLFLLFFVAPACFALGAFQVMTFAPHPTIVGDAMIFAALYFFSVGIVGGCFYFVQGVKGLTAWLVEKQRLARKRKA